MMVSSVVVVVVVGIAFCLSCSRFGSDGHDNKTGNSGMEFNVGSFVSMASAMSSLKSAKLETERSDDSSEL